MRPWLVKKDKATRFGPWSTGSARVRLTFIPTLLAVVGVHVVVELVALFNYQGACLVNTMKEARVHRSVDVVKEGCDESSTSAKGLV